jgi:protein-disulfide isomerase
MKRILPFVIILLVLGVALGAGWYLRNKASEPTPVAVSNPPTGASETSVTTTTPASASLEPGADPPHAIGPEDATVTIEEFGDFECPPCGLFHPELKKIEHTYGPRVRVIFREFPLVPAHQHALAAARAAEAAGLQGKFWEMHDLIYESQSMWKGEFDIRPVFEGYAKRIGLNVERFQKDIGSQAVEQRIFLDGKRAHSLNVKGTPTVFLNGREVPFESLPANKLGPLIDAELARSQK